MPVNTIPGNPTGGYQPFNFNPAPISVTPIGGINTDFSLNPVGGAAPGGGPVTYNIDNTRPNNVNWATGLNAITGLGNLALGYENLELGRDQYASSLAQYNRNLANQAQTINNQIQDDYRNTLIATGQAPTNPDGSVNYSALSNITDAYLEQRGVSGAAINP